MKKALVFLPFFLGLLSSTLFIMCNNKKSGIDAAMKAELEGKYGIAMQNFITAALKSTHSLEYPDKAKPMMHSQIDWPEQVTQYLAWVTYSLPYENKDLHIALEGIKRCSSYVTNENFITNKTPKALDQKIFKELWLEAFFQEKDAMKNHEKLINSALKDSLSFLKIRAMNGYVYHSELLDLHTGKTTSFILYPNSTISLLVKPRQYFLICTSEVKFAEGLRGKTWRSAANIIPCNFSQKMILYQVTLKTRVHRRK